MCPAQVRRYRITALVSTNVLLTLVFNYSAKVRRMAPKLSCASCCRCTVPCQLPWGLCDALDLSLQRDGGGTAACSVNHKTARYAQFSASIGSEMIPDSICFLLL